MSVSCWSSSSFCCCLIAIATPPPLLEQRSRKVVCFCLSERRFRPTLLNNTPRAAQPLFFLVCVSVNRPVCRQIEMLDGPRAGVCPVANAYDVSGLQKRRINAKPVRPKPGAFVPGEYDGFSRLQRRDGQSTRFDVAGLNRAVEGRAVRIPPRCVRASLREQDRSNPTNCTDYSHGNLRHSYSVVTVSIAPACGVGRAAAEQTANMKTPESSIQRAAINQIIITDLRARSSAQPWLGSVILGMDCAVKS